MASELLGLFGRMAESMTGGATNLVFPPDDAQDLQRGARAIPHEVTSARTAGQTVRFEQKCTRSACWFWEFPDGSRIHHRPSCHRQPEQCACGNTRLNGGKFAKDGTPLQERRP